MWILNFFRNLYRKIMPISNDEQQQLFRRTWAINSKRIHQEKLGKGMKVIGKVVGNVQLRDIGKVIPFDRIVDLNELEVNKSNDLQIALRSKWLDVVEDRGMLKRALVYQGQTTSITEDQDTKTIELAKEMAKAMVQEMLKDNDLLKKVADDVSQIKNNMGEQQVIIQADKQQTEEKKSKIVIEETDLSNVVIDVDETNTQAEIKEIGKVKEEESDISGSLEKMKRFRRKPKKND